MSQLKHLSGQEVEEWFRDFAQKAGIADKRTHSLEEVVRLLDDKLQWRLSQARLNAFQPFPDGSEWIDRITQGRSLPFIPADTRQEFVQFLLDRVVAIDVALKVKNSNGIEVAIAVDVTTNATKEADKLRKIRGHPGNEEGRNANNNRNIPDVRTDLGYDKHVVLILNDDPENLPSYEKLIDSIYAFAESKSRTRVIDLKELQPNERFNWRQEYEADPERMWQQYSAGLNLRGSVATTEEVIRRAIQAGHNEQAILTMLTRDPQYRQIVRTDKGDSLRANNYAATIYHRAKPKVMTQTQSVPAPEEIPKPEDWPKYASAIGRGSVIQARIKEAVAAYRQGEPLRTQASISLGKDFKDFQKELTSIRAWYKVAQQIDIDEKVEYLEQITKIEKDFTQGQPLSKEARAAMRLDINQLAYSQLSTKLDQTDSKAFLVRLATNAAKAGMRPSQIKEILSLSPAMKQIQQQQGEKASSERITKIIAEGLHLKNQEQPKQPLPRQQRDQDLDRGPSLGM
ncbi:MAG: hypothetical protein HC851_19235 [Acaryochloris sp. RU_4_1]|nr:hypothetical protein [Acaryochloris sp. RU_4_1]NJR57041.1 hypothetical protein [Acaryochloris sp. CRU_2_0]